MSDTIILMLGIPLAFIIGAIAGRYAQWKYWMMDKPYEDRLK